MVWGDLVRPALVIAATLVVAVITRWLLHRAIDKLVQASIERAEERDSSASWRSRLPLSRSSAQERERHYQRARTTGSLLRSVVSVVVLAVAVLTVMGEVGVPLAPLIASAGIGGVALGFGAQSLVRDFLSGIFMIVEDQYGVGDVVDTGTVVGTVEDVSLRITRIRDGNGVVWYVRNGEILRLGNQTQGWSTANLDVPLAPGTELDRALEVVRATAARLDAEQTWADRMTRAPEVVGVDSLAVGAVVVRVVLACTPGDADLVARELRLRLVHELDRHGIPLAGQPEPAAAAASDPAG